MKNVMSTNILTHSEIKKGSMSIEQLEAYLKNLYCGKVGLEYTYLTNHEERDFIKLELEEKL